MTPEERPGAFQTKPLWQRAAVVAAGPMANFLLAIVIYAAVNVTVGVRTIAPARRRGEGRHAGRGAPASSRAT